VRRYEDLPKEAQQYIDYVEEAIGIPITMIGVGPARDATVMRTP
jgi:adenylosuccinate synthase